MRRAVLALRAGLRYPAEHPLGRRVVAWTVACSTCVALLATGVQLFADYRRDLSLIEQRMTEIEHSYLESLAVSAWNIDQVQVRTQLRGILRLPDLSYVALLDAKRQPVEQVGNAAARYGTVRREFPVVFTPSGIGREKVALGTLVVTASLDGVYDRLGHQALLILTTQGIKTFFVVTFMLFIFQRLVSRPLSAVARAARQLNVNRLAEPIVLERKRRPGTADELDILVEAMNGMRSSLQRDVAELRETRRALWTSEERYRSLAESTSIVPWEADAVSGDITFVGPQVERILGIPRERWYERGFWRSVVHAEDRGRLLEALRKAHLAPPDLECRLVDGQGRLRWMSVRAARIDVPKVGKILRGYLIDIDAKKRTELELATYRVQLEELVAQRTAQLAANVTELEVTIEKLNVEMQERQRFEEELRKQALHDALTGLPNRSLLMDRLDLAIKLAQRNKHPLTLLFIDLDRFKVINDSLGHDAGDELLKTVTRRVSECVRTSDTFARLGGDEFVLLLPNAIPDEVLARLIGRITQAVSEPVVLSGHEVAVTCSIGCSVYPHDGTDSATLLKHADAAMYSAKEQGRNNVQRYTADLNQKVNEQLETESHLRRALQRGEFLLHYQPQVDLKSGEIVGVEALIRWQHPEWGMVPPLRFIPIAEDTGLIGPIGEWVLRTACAQAVAWQRAGLPPLRMSVNLSAQQFLNPALESQVSSALAESGLPAALLELELTESVSMKNPEDTIRILSRFNGLGINIAIDDFGTGYSNLAYLRRFPVHRVKLDRSFVGELTQQESSHVICEAIVAMAHKLNLEVVAEGVETIEQRDQLKAYGCDSMQGYWFSRPLSAATCEALLRERCGRGWKALAAA